MKGTILKCLGEVTEVNYGREVWERSLEEAGLNPETRFLPVADIDDQVAIRIVQAICSQLNLTLEHAADAFGDYWVNVYSQKFYPAFFSRQDTAKDFLLAMDDVHRKMTAGMENARPPGFKYEWKGENTLCMHYQSPRGLIDFAVGLARGVGNHYGETLKVVKKSPSTIEITFV